MQQSQVSFTLQNTSPDADVMAVLIPAGLRRGGILKGKFLATGKFIDELGGEIQILATAEEPKRAIAELDEYASQLEGIRIGGVLVETANLTQGTLNLVEKNYIQFKDSVSKNIPTDARLQAGVSGVMHHFDEPFVSGPMKNLEMKILKGETVRVTLFLIVPVNVQSQDQPQADANQHPVTN